ncbi:hypothetical protein EV360DRAFT_88328 [Lentinula raphanica]|nr:hypothetical protein EV360DRAFT_88328 [Lentinula raphanica]
MVHKEAGSTMTGNIFGLDITSLTFNGYFGEYVEKDAAVIYTSLKELEKTNKIWSWSKLPYTIRRVGSSLVDSNEQDPNEVSKHLKNDELVNDVDEWVLHNERFLRTLSKRHPDLAPALKPWSVGLVRIADLPQTLQCCSLIPSPTVSDCVIALKITRLPIDKVPGYTVLADRRSSMIFVQPSASKFRGRFDGMSGGLLAGLDWNNVFIAGGLVLGALLTPDVPPTVTHGASERASLEQPSEWISSDIDLYIYGLDVEAANQKIKHIIEVYQENLGSADAPFLVVRNSQTLTLYSEWPKRRVQIVLKLAKSPREVLLNFDLDICAVGWDGKQVWMLPRFVRALETGTNVFTMDLVNGHYLGDRKATRDKRVFKYAARGYGLRIIPLYTGYLLPFQSSESNLRAAGEVDKLKQSSLSLPLIASRARAWTHEIVNRYIQNDESDEFSTFHWPRMEGKNGLPMFSHALLERYGQITSEAPKRGRSCLTGFSLLMRHVALWEMEIAGTIDIHEQIFAEDSYNNIGQLAYDDTPAYEWDDSFTIPKFTHAIDVFSECETNVLQERWAHFAENHDEPAQFPAVKRVTYSSTIDEIFADKNNISIPIFATARFVHFANDILMGAFQELNLHEETTTSECPLKIVEPAMQENDVVLALWRLDHILTWQMLDRRIDEIREVLWAFYHVNKRALEPEPADCMEYLKIDLSKRATRIAEKDERQEFLAWVGREP